MLGGILKLTLFINVLFLFITLLWQTAIADASPILANDDDLVQSNDDVSYLSANNHRGAPVANHLLHSTVDQQSLIDNSRFRSRSRHRRLRKKIQSSKLKHSSNIFQPTGTNHNNLRLSQPFSTVIDDRLKRFRMLDPDEFQEMLNSLSHQIPDDQIKEFNNMDTIGGMQLENYWSRK